MSYGREMMSGHKNIHTKKYRALGGEERNRMLNRRSCDYLRTLAAKLGDAVDRIPGCKLARHRPKSQPKNYKDQPPRTPWPAGWTWRRKKGWVEL